MAADASHTLFLLRAFTFPSPFLTGAKSADGLAVRAVSDFASVGGLTGLFYLICFI
jgi:hypothetical protein